MRSPLQGGRPAAFGAWGSLAGRDRPTWLCRASCRASLQRSRPSAAAAPLAAHSVAAVRLPPGPPCARAQFSVQFRAAPDRLYAAFYSLQDPTAQVTSYGGLGRRCTHFKCVLNSGGAGRCALRRRRRCWAQLRCALRQRAVLKQACQNVPALPRPPPPPPLAAAPPAVLDALGTAVSHLAVDDLFANKVRPSGLVGDDGMGQQPCRNCV